MATLCWFCIVFQEKLLFGLIIVTLYNIFTEYFSKGKLYKKQNPFGLVLYISIECVCKKYTEYGNPRACPYVSANDMML